MQLGQINKLKMSKKRLYNARRLKDITASMGTGAVENLGVLGWKNGSMSTGEKVGMSYSKSAHPFPHGRLYPGGLRLDWAGDVISKMSSMMFAAWRFHA